MRNRKPEPKALAQAINLHKEPGIVLSSEAAEALRHLKARMGADPEKQLRLTSREMVALELNIPHSDDIMIEYRGAPLLAVSRRVVTFVGAGARLGVRYPEGQDPELVISPVDP